jgi:hypothetical protein
VWVAVTQRVIGDSVAFFYSDDLNDPSIALAVHQVFLSSNATFYPPDSRWIMINTPMHYPHFNEYSVRTLLALSIHALPPSHPVWHSIHGCMKILHQYSEPGWQILFFTHTSTLTQLNTSSLGKMWEPFPLFKLDLDTLSGGIH